MSLFFPPQPQPQYESLNVKQKLVVVIMNVLILAELTVSIIIGKHDPENIAVLFMSIFIPLVVITLIAARIIIRKLQKID